MRRVESNEEEQSFFLKLYDSLSEDVLAELEVLMQKYFSPGENSVDVNKEVEARITEIAENIGAHRFSLSMLFLLLCAKKLPGIYREKGIDEEFAYNLLYDLRCKLTECEKCENVVYWKPNG